MNLESFGKIDKTKLVSQTLDRSLGGSFATVDADQQRIALILIAVWDEP